MAGIPPARDTDSEDVAWALQTAEALWKRNERTDAIVWLRRASQAAAEIEDDDRAIELARDAADLTERAAHREGGAESEHRPGPGWTVENDTVDELLADASDPEPVDDDEVLEDVTDDLIERVPADSIEEVTDDSLTRVRADSIDQVTLPEISVEPAIEEPPRSGGALASALRKLARAKEQAAARAVAEKAGAAQAAPERANPAARAASLPAPVPPPRSLSPATPTAYLTPALATRTSSVPPPSVTTRSASSPPSVRASGTTPHSSSAPPAPASPEVPSAAEVHAGILDPWADAERSAAALPGDRPSVPGPGREFEFDEIVTSAPAMVKRGAGAANVPAKVSVAASTAAVRSPPPVDLEGVEALSDLPDDEREGLARCAVVRELGLGEDVSGFALVFVIEGSADVTGVQVHAPAMHLEAGAMLRGQGTLDKPVALRVVVSSNRARLATWTDQDVASAFRACPWVEDDLCAAGDRAQALVGATLGPLGSRLDPELRYQVTNRLALKVLASGDVVFRAGDVVSGFHVVGGGRIEIAGAASRAYAAGEFLLPTFALRAGPASSAVHAGEGGALLLVAERALAQELLVTCPPLLEILSSLT
jgi:hypothetical protein